MKRINNILFSSLRDEGPEKIKKKAQYVSPEHNSFDKHSKFL